ncbi:MAG: flavodoxin family protein [Acidimicrobiales bacterium]
MLTEPRSLRAVALNCTLKGGTEASSTQRLLEVLAAAFAQEEVEIEIIRVVDEHIAEGVTSDEGQGDGWPGVRARILDAQILVMGTPIWLGAPSSVARKALERMDAFLGEEDEQGRMISYDRVGVVATVGNEDGAHAVAAQLYQGMADLGFTIPPSAQAYWVGEAMGSVDFKDLDEVPESVTSTASDIARNATHLARLLQSSPYPPS